MQTIFYFLKSLIHVIIYLHSSFFCVPIVTNCWNEVHQSWPILWLFSYKHENYGAPLANIHNFFFFKFELNVIFVSDSWVNAVDFDIFNVINSLLIKFKEFFQISPLMIIIVVFIVHLLHWFFKFSRPDY